MFFLLVLQCNEIDKEVMTPLRIFQVSVEQIHGLLKMVLATAA